MIIIKNDKGQCFRFPSGIVIYLIYVPTCNKKILLPYHLKLHITSNIYFYTHIYNKN